jgi:hypothetical protein
MDQKTKQKDDLKSERIGRNHGYRRRPAKYLGIPTLKNKLWRILILTIKQSRDIFLKVTATDQNCSINC